MTVLVIEPPAVLITLQEIRRQITDLPSEDEAYVESLAVAASQWVDGPGGWLGRAVGEQVLEWVGRIDCSRFKLPYPPILAGVSVKTEDENGNEEDVPASLDAYRISRGEFLVGSGATWATQPVHRIRYRAGYVVVPQPIEVAILMLVAH